MLAGPTGGFIWGFFLFALLCSVRPRRESKIAKLALAFSGVALCHATGAAQYSLYKGCAFTEGLLLVSAPFILKDLALTFVAFGASVPLQAALKRAKSAVTKQRASQ